VCKSRANKRSPKTRSALDTNCTTLYQSFLFDGFLLESNGHYIIFGKSPAQRPENQHVKNRLTQTQSPAGTFAIRKNPELVMAFSG